MTNSEERWKLRISRIEDLRDRVTEPASLVFYQAVLEFQASLSRRFQNTVAPGLALRNQIAVSSLKGELRSIVEVCANYGPALLRQQGQIVDEAGEAAWQEILSECLSSRDTSSDPVRDFFARACLQPVAENLQLQLQKNEHYIGSVCQICGALPQMTVLRPEGEGSSRSLLCSFCFCEWSFRRVICPRCGEEEKEKLPRYSSEQWNYVHVEACETCKHYLKAIDLSINGLAVPLVDEAALAVLDVWATERGYTKIVRNLIGF